MHTSLWKYMDTHLLYPALETKEICRVAAVLLKNRFDLTSRHAQKTFYGQSIGWKRVSTQTLPFIVSAFNPAAPDKSNIFFSPVSEPSHAPSDFFQFFRPRALAILLRTQTLRVQIRPSETSTSFLTCTFPITKPSSADLTTSSILQLPPFKPTK